ncbi:MAG TPA: ABC transporter permease [Candidatus Kapabacteria bacterium]|nr:ABC transporter permease [Candidatus Kapabacteria bacterium]
MNTFISDTLHLLIRHLRTTLRIPIWIVVTLVQPVIWLTLYGQLFRRVVELPGFGNTTYIQFLTPGVVIMTALFGSAWSGMGLIEDLNEGVMDRMLATPAHRGALIAARVLHAAVTVLVQSLIILLFGLVLGASLPGGIGAFLAILGIAALLGAGFSAFSNGVALLTRREETLIAVINFFGMPLTFLSTAFMAATLMPSWIGVIATVNPVNWGVNAARDAMAGVNWGGVGVNMALLAGFVLVTSFFASQAFRVYRRAA